MITYHLSISHHHRVHHQYHDQTRSEHHMKIIEYIHKGENCLTEMYSAIEAEVPIPTDPNTQTNTGLIAKLKLASKLLICGQAKSHTVNYTTKVKNITYNLHVL